MNDESSKKSAGSILIVDDTPKNIQVLAGILTSRGYRVTAAVSGENALASVATSRPDLILLDVMMPGIDGFETCRRLKAEKGTRDIPVIFLTAKDDMQDVIAGFSAGAVDYVTKPFRQEELLARVSTHVEMARNRRQIEKTLQDRRELIHVLCHDLSNPLTFLLNISELAQYDSSVFSETVRRDMVKVTHNAAQMIRLVRTMSALEEGKLKPKTVACDLRELVAESLSVLQHLIKAKGITVDVAIPDMQVQVERTSFVNSVLNNLLTNAVKFSPRASTIAVRGEARDGRATLSVRDRGVGMPAELLEHLFEPGRPTTRTGTEGEEGTGYGMLLLKNFVESYGGAISIASREAKDSPGDHGTEVVLTLRTA